MNLNRRTLMALLTGALAVPLGGLFRAIAAGVSGTVTAVVNSAKARKPDATPDAAATDIALNDPVEAGTTVETSKQSAVQITMADGSVATIGARSNAAVGGAGTQALAMGKGNFRYRSGSGDTVNKALTTPALNITLKGTQIVVSIDDTRTICGVIDGAITCTSKKTGKAVEVAAGESVLWSAGSFGNGAMKGVFTTGDIAVDQGIAAAAEAWKPAAPPAPPPPPRPRPQPPKPQPGRK